MDNTQDSYAYMDVYSGKVYIKSSLVGTTHTSLTYSITAICGLLQSKTPFILTMTISDTNIHAPVFDSHHYVVEANESMPIGTVLLQLQAHDEDSPALTYSIVDGDPTGRFSLDSLTGTRTVRQISSILNTFVPSVASYLPYFARHICLMPMKKCDWLSLRILAHRQTPGTGCTNHSLSAWPSGQRLHASGLEHQESGSLFSRFLGKW